MAKGEKSLTICLYAESYVDIILCGVQDLWFYVTLRKF